MKNIFKPQSLLRFLIPLCLAAFCTTSYAENMEVEKKTSLHKVMEKLGHDMEAVTTAISKEDWDSVAELAARIASHEEPEKSEKVEILTWLGDKAGKFRGFDLEVTDAATAMGEAAEQGDGLKVIESFSKTQQSCFACHQMFRKPFVEKFYGKSD